MSPVAPVLDLPGLLDGARLLVMGGTGFLGKVWLSLLLDRFPQVEHVWLVVRERRDKSGRLRQSSADRFWADVAGSPVFDPLRERHGDGFEAFLKQKITPIHGDITLPLCGVTDEVRDQLRGTMTALVNSSGVVDFNPPLDYALNTNAFGMKNLVALCQDLGPAGGSGLPMLHTSTCYVAGDRTGQVDEVHPLSYPFPKCDQLDRSHWDADREIAECLDLIDNVRHRANDAFRQSAFLDQAKKALFERNEPARGSALDDELHKVRRRFIDQQLVEWGTERAKYWGWHNIYTYTKSIGEQILCRSGLPFAIGRPAVIESALTFPRVGWNEGINTSGPLIFMAVEGPYAAPTTPDSVLDVIPVDIVAAGMMCSLGELLEGRPKPVYQYGSSDQNPMSIHRMVELVGLFKRQHYRARQKNPLVDFVQSHYESIPITLEQYQTRGPRWLGKTLTDAAQALQPVAKGAARDLLGPAVKGLREFGKMMEVQARISDQFVPFTATHNYRFSTRNTRDAHARLPEALKPLIDFAPERIDWRDYMLRVHCPGIEENVSPQIREKMKKTAKPLARHDDLIAMLDELAERHGHAPALMRTHEDGFSRLSYADLRSRAQAVAVRLRAAGAKPGDRVVLAGRNHPWWVVSWFGVIAAGCVVVPMDPATEPARCEVIFASAEPRVALLDKHAREAFGGAIDQLQVIDLHEVCALGAVGRVPQPGVDFPVSADTLASVLYTSGTTGDPKGVMLTHGNLCSMVASIGRLFTLTSEDRLLSVLPLHHAFEFSCGLLMPLSMGARVIYLDEVNGDRLAYGLQQGRVTAMVGVPALWQLLERRVRAQVKEKGRLFELAFDQGLSWNRALGKATGLDAGRLLFGSVHSRFGGQIRVLISGGAALPRETQNLFGGLGLHLSEGYGLTEASPVLTVAMPGPGGKVGTVGKPIPGVDVRIDNPDDQGVGEVLARGPNVMKGYFANEGATRAVVTADGWLRTGDMGKIDRQGRLTLVGRAKEVVVTSAGENIYLDDTEVTLGPIRYVKEYALVGLEDPRGGERLGMLAVPDDEAGMDRRQLHERAEQAIKDAVARLPPVQRPAVVHLVDADLPRTATKKVQRKAVRETLERITRATPNKARRGAGVRGPVLDAIAAVAGVRPDQVSPEADLRGAFGFDSLMFVELSSALEHVGEGRPDAEALARCQTVGEVIALAGQPAPLAESRDAEKADGAYFFPAHLADRIKPALATVQGAFNGPGLGTRVEGRRHIPQNRQTIVVCNHTSHLDMGLVKFALGDYGKRLAALGAQDYFFEGNRLKVTWFTHFTNVEPIDRKSGFRMSMRMAHKVLEEGKIVLLFPEGTRQTDGQLAEFKPMVGKLALESGVDILPLYIDGAHRLMPKGRPFPTGRGVTVRIGPPLGVEQLRKITEGMSPSAAARKVSELTREAVRRLGEGGLLDLQHEDAGALDPASLAPATPDEIVARCLNSLPARFDPARHERDITWYFALGDKDGPRATLTLTREGPKWRKGRPEGDADCVVKMGVESFRRIVEEAWVPDPAEFFNGSIKTSDLGLLVAFSQVFQLSPVEA